jgi:hypothetical protein
VQLCRHNNGCMNKQFILAMALPGLKDQQFVRQY